MDAARVSLYLERDSALSRLHPQVKLGLLAGVFLSAFSMERAVAIAPITIAVFALLASAGAFENVRRLRLLFVAVPVATFLIWSLFYGVGSPLPVLGGLGVTRESVQYASGMALKLETFLASSILFLSITRVEEFTAAMRGLGVPFRVSFTIALSFRLVPLFLASALSVVDAQRSRGLEFSEGGFYERLKRYVPVIVPVFMGALRRADAMAIALETRGFGDLRGRTTYTRSAFGARDLIASAAIGVACGAYVWAWIRGYGRVGG